MSNLCLIKHFLSILEIVEDNQSSMKYFLLWYHILPCFFLSSTLAKILNKVSVPYESSFTVGQALLQCLASISSIGNYLKPRSSVLHRLKSLFMQLLEIVLQFWKKKIGLGVSKVIIKVLTKINLVILKKLIMMFFVLTISYKVNLKAQTGTQRTWLYQQKLAGFFLE